jgi:hypothetical protein
MQDERKEQGLDEKGTRGIHQRLKEHFISSLRMLCACALLLAAGAAQAQLLQRLLGSTELPDPLTYGVQVEAGNLPQVREWLDLGLPPDFTADRIGTGLMIAAWHGNVPMMALLVSRGADVNRANANGESALMHAAWRGQLEAIKWLLERGARINSGPMQWSALHYAVFAGRSEAAALLIERGADINARSTNGSSVIMMAVYEGHEPLVKQLLEKGADLTVKNDRGEGALDWAFKFKRLGIARMVSSPQEFVAAASRPSAQWGEAVRSQPAPPEGPPSAQAEADPQAVRIQQLVGIRNALDRRGMKDSVAKLDRRIAALRAQQARAYKDSIPSAVLEISARRGKPGEQSTRMIIDKEGPPP